MVASGTNKHLIHDLQREMNRKEEVELMERELTNFLAFSSNYQNIAKTSFSEFLAAGTKKPGVKMIEKLRKPSYDAWIVREAFETD